VLGLGDTNYDKFCHMGKSIDKRLGELGGNRVLSLACADEATNLEETVEAWKVEFFELIKKLHQPSSSTTTTATTEAEEVSAVTEQVSALKVEGEKAAE
jgi:sulfite reductase alpha subunit-like flavoprotein